MAFLRLTALAWSNKFIDVHFFQFTAIKCFECRIYFCRLQFIWGWVAALILFLFALHHLLSIPIAGAAGTTFLLSLSMSSHLSLSHMVREKCLIIIEKPWWMVRHRSHVPTVRMQIRDSWRDIFNWGWMMRFIFFRAVVSILKHICEFIPIFWHRTFQAIARSHHKIILSFAFVAKQGLVGDGNLDGLTNTLHWEPWNIERSRTFIQFGSRH